MEHEADSSDTSDEEGNSSESEDMSDEPDFLDRSYRPNDSLNSDDEPDSSDTSACSDDSATSDVTHEEGNCDSSSAEVDPIKEKKYLVSASMLMQLFAVCIQCLAPTRTKLRHQGTFVHAVITCVRGHKNEWQNQALVNGKALLNILLPAAVTYSGASPTRVLRLLSSIGVAVLRKSQFYKVQGCLVFPAATKAWRAEQTTLLAAMHGRRLHLAGDGRADSPGYSTKYGA